MRGKAGYSSSSSSSSSGSNAFFSGRNTSFVLAMQPTCVLRGHEDAVNAVEFVGNELLLSAGGDGVVKAWGLASRRSLHSLKASNASLQSIQSLSHHQFVTSGRDGFICLWDLSTESASSTPISSLPSNCRHFCGIDALRTPGSPTQVIASADHYTTALVWDLRQGTSPVAAFATSADAIGVQMSDSATHGMLTSLLFHSLLSEGGGYLSCGYEDGAVATFDIRMPGGHPLHVVAEHTEAVFALAESKSGQILSGGGDGLLACVASCPTPQLTEKVVLPVEGTSDIACRSDQRLFASAHWDHTVRVFQCKGLKPLVVLRHHRDSVQAVRFCSSGDNRSQCMMASASKDHTIALWDVLSDTFRR